MHHLKKTVLLYIFLPFIFCHAQDLLLTQTGLVKQIENIYKKSYSFNNLKIKSISLKEISLVVEVSNGDHVRKDLSKPDSLLVSKMRFGYVIHYSSDIFDSLLWAIQQEKDAKDLKILLEKLIATLN